MAIDETKNLRCCYEVLRKRIADEDDHNAFWRMKLKVATYFLKKYDSKFDPYSWDYAKELSDGEESFLLKNHPLLQGTKHDGVRFRRSTREFEDELRKKIEKYLKSKA